MSIIDILLYPFFYFCSVIMNIKFDDYEEITSFEVL